MPPQKQARLHGYTAKRIERLCPSLTMADGIERLARRYEDVYTAGLDAARRALTPSEAMLILDVQNATLIEPLWAWLGDGLAHQVEDGCALDGLDTKWEVDGPALAAKLRALGPLAQLALCLWAEIAWESGTNFQVEAAKFKG